MERERTEPIDFGSRKKSGVIERYIWQQMSFSLASIVYIERTTSTSDYMQYPVYGTHNVCDAENGIEQYISYYSYAG